MNSPLNYLLISLRTNFPKAQKFFKLQSAKPWLMSRRLRLWWRRRTGGKKTNKSRKSRGWPDRQNVTSHSGNILSRRKFNSQNVLLAICTRRFIRFWGTVLTKILAVSFIPGKNDCYPEFAAFSFNQEHRANLLPGDILWWAMYRCIRGETRPYFSVEIWFYGL